MCFNTSIGIYYRCMLYLPRTSNDIEPNRTIVMQNVQQSGRGPLRKKNLIYNNPYTISTLLVSAEIESETFSKARMWLPQSSCTLCQCFCFWKKKQLRLDSILQYPTHVCISPVVCCVSWIGDSRFQDLEEVFGHAYQWRYMYYIT